LGELNGYIPDEGFLAMLNPRAQLSLGRRRLSSRGRGRSGFVIDELKSPHANQVINQLFVVEFKFASGNVDYAVMRMQKILSRPYLRHFISPQKDGGLIDIAT
jgi:hypothetical protein